MERAAAQPQEKLPLVAAFAERNVLICAVMGVLLVSYLVICWAFMPLYLTRLRGIRSANRRMAYGDFGCFGDDRRFCDFRTLPIGWAGAR